MKMTEHQWLVGKDPIPMLEMLIGHSLRQTVLDTDCIEPSRISARQLRMFSCACCLISKTAVETVNGYERDGAPWDAYDSRPRKSDLLWAMSWISVHPRVTQERKAMILREIVGNPFHAVPEAYQGKVLIPAKSPTQKYGLYAGIGLLPVVHYLVPIVLSLAQASYEDQNEFGILDSTILAILADALEDAGCTNEPILEHLRDDGPHFRGCWALDLLLGRE